MPAQKKLYEAIYNVYQGNLFESAWMGNGIIGDAILDWAKKAWPDWYNKVGDNPLYVETCIRDEEGADELNLFFDSLSPDLLRQALEPIYYALKENFAGYHDAKKLIVRLGQILDPLPSTKKVASFFDRNLNTAGIGEMLAKKYCDLVNTDSEACFKLFCDDCEYVLFLGGKPIIIERHKLLNFLRGQQGLQSKFSSYKQDGDKHNIKFHGYPHWPRYC